MAVNVILTFDVEDEMESRQEFFDLKLPVSVNEQDAAAFMHAKLFKRIASACMKLGRDPKRLIKISTASNWRLFTEKTGQPSLTSLGHPCKWWFGAGRNDLDAWEKDLISEFSFGVDVD